MTADFHGLLSTLKVHEVAFVVIGGAALVLHGSARSTQDLDICYSRDRSNLLRLAEASLERAKAAAGRLKDVLDIAEIRILRSRQRN